MDEDLEKIKAMFGKMEKNGWDTTRPLKWGFFFMSRNEKNLKQIYEKLKDYGYVFENIHQDEDLWVLQSSKTESLTPEKLHKRNMSFVELACAYDSIYDGWDVGKKDEIKG